MIFGGESLGTLPVKTLFLGRDPNEPLIAKPTDAQTRMIARLTTGQYCGNCSYFNREAGQREAARQRFWERLKHEEGWKGGKKWYGDPTRAGLCEYYGDAIVSQDCPVLEDPLMPGSGCEYYRPARGRIVFFGLKRILGGDV